MIKAFPKIFSIGQDYIRDLFQEEVEITEKIDGSQFDFGKIDGELYYRSKGVVMSHGSESKMFEKAIQYVISIQDKIEDNTVYFAEYLATPHHNVLTYNRTPNNNIILFGISSLGDKFIDKYDDLKRYADKLGIETVPLLCVGKIGSSDELLKLLETESVLGGTTIEGVVVKNYARPFLLGGQPIPLMAGKFVSEKFKEIAKSWGKEHTSRGKFETFKTTFRTETRWQKAIQHLRDDGKLQNSPKDIGELIKEIKKDITEEEKENIKKFLWEEFSDEILRYSTGGFPEWYKEKLLKDSFEQ